MRVRQRDLGHFTREAETDKRQEKEATWCLQGLGPAVANAAGNTIKWTFQE